MTARVSTLVRPLRRLYVASGLQAAIPHDVKNAVRSRWLPLARTLGYPVSSPRLPRPQLPRDKAPMRLEKALMASDLNPDYLAYWPSARRAWLEIVGVEPMLVLVAEESSIPDELRADPLVVPFEPLPGIHTAMQAQCVRLLYPALLETVGAVIISDVDLYPLRRSYFVDPIASVDRRFFVSYRDVRLEWGQVAIAFNAAVPETWSELFEVSSLEDVRARLREWADGVEYDGRRAWPGWFTDQETLYRVLTSWTQRSERWWAMDDDYTRYRRLDKLELEHEDGLEAHRREGLLKQEYSDYVCLFPYQEHRAVSDLILQLGVDAARRNPDG